jgi:hypothetical protein
MAFSENGLEIYPSQYYKCEVDSDLGVGTSYIEFTSQGYAIRQCDNFGERWFNSLMGTWHPATGCLAMFDQQLTEEGKKHVLEITPETFEDMWKLSQQ